jgi:3-oxoacyl-[acyl-carrier protein] reductase
MTLAGKVAIVTGGSRGIGRAVCLGLADHGAQVAFCHLDDPQADETRRLIDMRSRGFEVSADVSQEAAVEQFFDASCTALGVPDILVNCAGILMESPAAETRMEDFDRVVAVNLRGSFLAARAFVRRARSGRIINIASDLGLSGRENMAAYTASKGAIISLTRTLALELAPDILVNAVAPGATETDMTRPENMSPAALAKDLDTPLARFGRPEEIASMVCYLAGPQSTFITGQCIGVNGGSVLH